MCRKNKNKCDTFDNIEFSIVKLEEGTFFKRHVSCNLRDSEFGYSRYSTAISPGIKFYIPENTPVEEFKAFISKNEDKYDGKNIYNCDLNKMLAYTTEIHIESHFDDNSSFIKYIIEIVYEEKFLYFTFYEYDMYRALADWIIDTGREAMYKSIINKAKAIN